MENERRIMRGASAVLSRKGGFDVRDLLPPQQAIITFLSRAALLPPRVEAVDLDHALGRVLASDLISDRAFPDVPRSTMDGYAIRADDVPATLRIVAEVQMGAQSRASVAAQQAARIPTGGVVPSGADAVVPFERVSIDGETIQVADHVRSGDCITQRGEDIREGEHIFSAGRRIGPAEIGVLATLGCGEVAVFSRPLVAVTSSGDELVEPAALPKPGQVRDSNRYAIAATLRAMGATVVHYPTARDREGALEEILRSALAASDAIVLSGGSSVGERDRTPEAISALGDPGVIVHGLRVKPGKPTVLAAIEGKPIVGLPGNPTSALMILETIGAPIVAALTGTHLVGRPIDAELHEGVESRRGWTWFVPVTLSPKSAGFWAHPLPLRSSLTTLCARADGFIIVDEDTERLGRGTTVHVHSFSKG